MAKLAAPSLLGDSTTYRYKLTFNVATPDGVKSASSVAEIKSEVSGSFWHAGAADHVKGEALYLDLGPGRRPIVALIWRPPVLRDERPYTRWGEVSPSGLLSYLMGITPKPDFDYQKDLINERRRMKSVKSVFEVNPKDLPDLVTFANVADPNSAMVVEAEHLDATLGPGIRWQSITIQIVDEPVTRGLEKRLPWLKSIHGVENINGTPIQQYAANQLSRLPRPYARMVMSGHL